MSKKTKKSNNKITKEARLKEAKKAQEKKEAKEEKKLPTLQKNNKKSKKQPEENKSLQEEKTKDEKEENFLTHLEAFREALVKSIISLCIALPLGLIAAPRALDFLTKYLIGKNKFQFNFFSPTEVFIIQIKMALLNAFVIAFPYIARKLWEFILPALYDNEKKFIQSTIILSMSLFVLGNVFCFFAILPLIINFGLSFTTANINPVFSISTIINLVLGLCVVFGLMFQIPLVIHSLIKWDIISYDSVQDKRPFVVVILLIISGILTPPDIVSQVMLFIPTYLLFECGLISSKKYRKKGD